MILLNPSESQSLRTWFTPEHPGPLVGMHVLNTGNGACFVDRWPEPTAVLADSAGNYALRGHSQALRSEDLARHVQGFVEAPEHALPRLMEVFPDLVAWKRVVLALTGEAQPCPPPAALVRRLERPDAHHLWGLSPEVAWIVKTWGGPPGLAASGLAWGAFVAGQLAAVASPFFLGERYADIGVVTEAAFRGQGLSTACAGALIQDIRARGKQASWTTSPGNLASLGVAEKLGFRFERFDWLYVVGVPLPAG